MTKASTRTTDIAQPMKMDSLVAAGAREAPSSKGRTMSSRLASEKSPPIASVEPAPPRGVAASRAWLGTRTWPAYCAAGITAAFGVLKAYWVFGGTALWVIAPLPQSMIEKARSHTAPGWFVIADAATVVLAVVGVVFALATVRPRRWLPVWLVCCSLWPLAALMVLRAMLATLSDVHQLATGASTRTTLWGLVLWSPLFLIWGLLWAATALTYARRAKTTRAQDG